MNIIEFKNPHHIVDKEFAKLEINPVDKPDHYSLKINGELQATLLERSDVRMFIELMEYEDRPVVDLLINGAKLGYFSLAKKNQFIQALDNLIHH